MSSENSVESLGTLQWDIMELANHLRQERLFVTSEQQNLQILNEKVSNNKKKKKLKIKTIYDSKKKLTIFPLGIICIIKFGTTSMDYSTTES